MFCQEYTFPRLERQRVKSSPLENSGITTPNLGIMYDVPLLSTKRRLSTVFSYRFSTVSSSLAVTIAVPW